MIGAHGIGDCARHPARDLPPVLRHILREARRDCAALERAQRDGTSLAHVLDLAAARVGFELSSLERDLLLTHLELDERPFGVLQSLVDDPEISDVIVSGYDCVAVQQGRMNQRTDVAFTDRESYRAFVDRLVQQAGGRLSIKQPIADGMIGTSYRIHAVHESLCEGGPYLTVRINRFQSVSIGDLVQAELAPQEVFDYLVAVLRAGQTVLIVGEVGCGKTTLARALGAALPEREAILVIEDTPEIQIAHPHVRYLRTREVNSEGAGSVPPAECIRGGMRMAMNRIIFGEIRDAQAAEAFVDVCASGHPGLSTLHARSSSEAVTRLELFLARAQRGVGKEILCEQIATAVQVIVFLDVCRRTGCRRIWHIRELGPVSEGVLRQRDIFRYEISEGAPVWRVVNRVSAHRDAIEEAPREVRLSALPPALTLPAGIARRPAFTLIEGCT